MTQPLLAPLHTLCPGVCCCLEGTRKAARWAEGTSASGLFSPFLDEEGPRVWLPQTQCEIIWLLAGHSQTSSRPSRVPARHCHTPAELHRFPRDREGPGALPTHQLSSRDCRVPRHADRTWSALRPRRQAAADSQGVAAPRPALTFPGRNDTSLGPACVLSVRLGENGTGGRRGPDSLALLWDHTTLPWHLLWVGSELKKVAGT